jgi:signal transduction histidine kinase
VRPRTLAALAAAARRLEAPGAAAAALSRLGRLDEEVRRLDRLAALGDLVAEVVHEVRNPLVSVKTFLQLLPQRIDDPEFRVRFFDVVTNELRRIERLLDVVLEHARPRGPQGVEAAAAVGPVLTSVARLLTHRALERGVQIEIETGEALPAAQLGEDRLRQVLLNLALNAIDATPTSGKVRLAARATPTGVELTVEDQGPGIPPELRPRIFEPFFSTKRDRPGGLGLTISRRIVEESGGSIAVDDGPGGGAVFRVGLPAANLSR